MSSNTSRFNRNEILGRAKRMGNETEKRIYEFKS
jgi:hypothetical protein